MKKRGVHHTTKTAAQLDAEIDDALYEAARDEENAKNWAAIQKLSPREQEMLLSAQEISALSDLVKAGGLRLDHENDGFIHARGKTFIAKDVLKQHKFRWDGKEWVRRYAPAKTAGKIDYLTLYADLVKVLR